MVSDEGLATDCLYASMSCDVSQTAWPITRSFRICQENVYTIFRSAEGGFREWPIEKLNLFIKK